MRALFTVQPSFSHAAQLIPLARALENAGHSAAFAASPPFAQQLRQYGVHARDAGPAWTVRPGDPVFDRTVGAQNFFGFAQLADGEYVAEIERIARDVEADVIVRDYAEFAGYKAAKRLNLPLVTHGIMHRLPPPLFERVVQLAGATSAADLLGAAFLDVVPRSLRLPWEQDAPFIHAVQTGGFDGPRKDESFEWLESLGARRPLIYFTLGTVFTGFQRVRRAVFEALAAMDVDVVYTAAGGAAPEDVPANVRVESYVPQSLVLPRAAVTICHGGFGTLMGSLRFGVPVLALPVAADQPVNARSLAKAGAGINGANAPAVDARGPMIDENTLDASEIAKSVTRLLSDCAFATRAKEIAGEIRTLPGPGEVVELLTRSLPRLKQNLAPAVRE